MQYIYSRTLITSFRSGPDWKSRIKHIKEPQDPRYPAAEIFENNWKAMRPFPCKFSSLVCYVSKQIFYM